MRVDDVPEGIDPAAWMRSSDNQPVDVGDLWLLSWDREVLGLAVIAGVAPTFVLVWPASLPQEEAFPPAVEVPSEALGVTLAVWPTRETGIGLHLLHRCFGRVMSPRSMNLVVDEMERATGESPFPHVAVRPDGLDVEAASDVLVDRWEAICLHTWPQVAAGTSPLSPEKLHSAGLVIETVADMLGATTPDAVALFRGERYPSVDELRILAATANVAEEDLLDIPDLAVELARPAYKDALLSLTEALQTDETHARDLVRQELALAARSDGDAAGLIQGAIARVRERSAL